MSDTSKLLIFVESDANKNKFYQLDLDGDKVTGSYGRVGGSTQTKVYAGGQAKFNSILKAKLKKGYTESKIITPSEDVIVPTGGQDIMTLAMSQVKTDDISKILLKHLIDKNIHNIVSNTKVKYDAATGYFKTALGAISSDGVTEALCLLDQIKASKYLDTPAFRKLNDLYFRIVPTQISNLRSLHSLICNDQKVQEQRDICEALQSSIDIIESTKKAATKKVTKKSKAPKLFEASLLHLKDKKEYDRIVKYFESSKNSRHGHNSYKVTNIFNVSLGKEAEEFRSDLPNQMELFHGTKIANLLSILKSGLLMPKQSPGQTTGYMFGQGLYFASQSTKSLNYCDGMYWNNSAKTNKIYMFVADIAMGNYEVPSGCRSQNPPAGYDSYWAQPGKSGIQNDEMIVFANNQIKLKYILEISQ